MDTAHAQPSDRSADGRHEAPADGRLRGLARLLADRRLTAKAAAAVTGVHAVMICRLANCTTGAQVATAQRLATGLGCSLDELIQA